MLYANSMIEADVFKMLASVPMSPMTKDNYERYCRNWFTWFFDKHPSEDPSKIDASMIFEWFASNEAWKPATKYAALAAVKKFYRWKFGDDHPITRVKVRRLDPGPQRTLEKDELLDVLAAIDTTSVNGIRDLAIISLMVDTGLRASEMCNLELNRLDLKKQRLTVVVKGGGIAEKLFFDYTSACIENWLGFRPRVASPGMKYVFVAVGGKNPGHKMTVSGLRYITNKLSRLSEVGHFSAHALRRTFATLATENGAPSRVVQVAGGWKSIRMVERYTRTLKPEAIKPFSPIDHLMND